MANVNMVALGPISPVITKNKQVGANLSSLLNSGKFNINGATIKINTGDSLTLIADKINKHKSKTGITAQVVNNNQLVLKSKKAQVDIIDYGVLSKVVKQGMLGPGSNCLLRIVKAELGGEISENVMINYSQGKKTAEHRNANPLLEGEIIEHLADEARIAEEARMIEAWRRAEEARRAEDAWRAKDARIAEEREKIRIIEEIRHKVKLEFKAKGIQTGETSYTEKDYNDLPTTRRKLGSLLQGFECKYLAERKSWLEKETFKLLNNNRVYGLMHPIISVVGKFAITNDELQTVLGKVDTDYQLWRLRNRS